MSKRTYFDLGIPRHWHLTEFSKKGGLYLLDDYRRKPPSNINSIMAMYVEIYLWNRRLSAPITKVIVVLRDLIGWPRKIIRALLGPGIIARQVYSRSLLGQAIDLTRARTVCGLHPNKYYDAHMARHDGGAAVTNYLDWDVLSSVVIQLQRDTFGSPPFVLNDKAAFAAWCRSNGLPSPHEIVLDSGGPMPSAASLSELGDRLFVKLRSGLGGVGAEAWDLKSDKMWHWRDRELTTEELAKYLVVKAAADPVGLVVQERLCNHPALQATCGEVLSTWRLVTLLNEKGVPELVQWAWRMATDPNAITDNISGGGTVWFSHDLNTGEIVRGDNRQVRTSQVAFTHHPVTGQKMVGSCFPFGSEVRAMALRAHEKLKNVVVAGWDIAMAENGPLIVELNFPPALTPVMQVVWDGLEASRLGDILGWRARNWLKQNIDAQSKRQVATRWKKD